MLWRAHSEAQGDDGAEGVDGLCGVPRYTHGFEQKSNSVQNWYTDMNQHAWKTVKQSLTKCFVFVKNSNEACVFLSVRVYVCDRNPLKAL